MQDCVFCRIAARQIPAEIVREDESTCAFRDISPQAPQHFLIIPKEHHPNLDDMTPEAMGALLHAARELAREESIESYRLVLNKGELSGQSVFHVHVHLLSGRALSWPPG